MFYNKTQIDETELLKYNLLGKFSMKKTNEKLITIDYPNSLGMLYSTITSYLGFKPNEGEYKVMGLAPYGSPVYINEMEKVLIKCDSGLELFKLNLNFITFTIIVVFELIFINFSFGYFFNLSIEKSFLTKKPNLNSINNGLFIFVNITSPFYFINLLGLTSK